MQYLKQTFWLDGAEEEEAKRLALAENRPAPVSEPEIEITSIVETRLSGFVLHAMILGSVTLLPLLGSIPMPVIYGIFLYLGRKVLTGNEFVLRLVQVKPAASGLRRSWGGALAALGGAHRRQRRRGASPRTISLYKKRNSFLLFARGLSAPPCHLVSYPLPPR